ncbi:MAG: tetratricopeptide repeat protein [Gemmatimonadales bacterium]
MSGRRLYAAIALASVVVYLGALWNQFVLDDQIVVLINPLLEDLSGVWRAFGLPYWPPELRAQMYRPLTIATLVVDQSIGGVAWFHAVNLLWHAGTAVAVAALARRWCGDRAALLAGLLFAVHPVHVEAVAYVTGRADLMATAFALLAVYAAVERDSIVWSVAAMVAGLLSKESAAVAPALIAAVWIFGVRPAPPRRRLAAFVGSWVGAAIVYAAVRWSVLGDVAHGLFPMFRDASPVAIRLTAVAALADVARLLVFPLTLRIDYAPGERTLVTSLLDGRFWLGMLCLALWAVLLVRTFRAGRRVEATGLAWIAIAFLPVANLLFPSGILLAERTLYLPSAGLALAVGAWLKDLAPRRFAAALAVVVLAGGLRTALRVPAYRTEMRVTLSMLEDSPRSYRGLARAAGAYYHTGQPEKALGAYRAAIRMYDREPTLYVSAALAALKIGRGATADSLLAGAEAQCGACEREYAFYITIARWEGDSALADSLAARQRRRARPAAP